MMPDEVSRQTGALPNFGESAPFVIMDHYANIAPVYDALTASFLSGPRKDMADLCLELGARRVLDFGCGTGIFVNSLAGRVELAVGIDCSPAMLARRKRGLSGFYVAADAAAPPFAPGSFDLVVCGLLLHESGERAESLLESAFLLAPKVMVLEWRMPERNLDWLCGLWTHAVERLAGKAHYRSFRRFMRLGGLNGLARRCGARTVTEKTLAGSALVLACFEKKP